MFELLHTIKDILLGFFDAVGTFCEWVGELLTDISDVAVKASLAVVNVTVWFTGLLPIPLLGIFLSIIAIVVIYKVLGREG